MTLPFQEMDPATLRACALELERLADDAVSGTAPSDTAVVVARGYRAVSTRWRKRAAWIESVRVADGCPVCHRLAEWCACEPDEPEEP